jgi:hypothetical protein
MEELAELNAFAKRYGNAELAIEVSRNMVATERGRMASTEIADHFTDAYADNAVYSADVAMDALIFDGRKVVRGILGRIARSYIAEDIQNSNHFHAQAKRVSKSRDRWTDISRTLDHVSEARLAVCLAIDALAPCSVIQPGLSLLSTISAAKDAVAKMGSEIAGGNLIDGDQERILRSFGELGTSEETEVPAVAAEACRKVLEIAIAATDKLDAALVRAAGIMEDEVECLAEIEQPYLQRAALLVPERIAGLVQDFGGEANQQVEGLAVRL